LYFNAFLELWLLNYLWKMRGKNDFSFWIPITLVKISFFPIVITFAKIHLHKKAPSLSNSGSTCICTHVILTGPTCCKSSRSTRQRKINTKYYIPYYKEWIKLIQVFALCYFIYFRQNVNLFTSRKIQRIWGHQNKQTIEQQRRVHVTHWV